MVFSNDQATNDEIDALFNTLADEQAAAWVQFYAIEADSRPGELEYDRALAAARLDAAISDMMAAAGRTPFYRGVRTAGRFSRTSPAKQILRFLIYWCVFRCPGDGNLCKSDDAGHGYRRRGLLGGRHLIQHAWNAWPTVRRLLSFWMAFLCSGGDGRQIGALPLSYTRIR